MEQDQDVDISKRTLVMLVILSCVISIVGVVAMIYEFSNTHMTPIILKDGGTSSAKVAFAIDAPQNAPTVKTTGMASFEVKKHS